MRTLNLLFSACLIVLFCNFTNSITAQNNATKDTAKTVAPSPLSCGVDFQSRYIWRGSDYGNSPSIQPVFTYKYKNLSAGAWGAYAYNGSYSETDLFLSYNYKWFTIGLTDYYIPVGNKSGKYFEYKPDTTAHILEGAITLGGTEKFPLKLMVATCFHGNDITIKANGTKKTNYSTYIEALYPFLCKGSKFDMFVGYTPNETNIYGTTQGFVNCGIKVYKDITVTNSFTLPVYCTLITNPQAEKIFFVFGLTL